MQSDQLAAHAANCDDLSGEAKFTSFAIERFMRSDDPAVQLDVAKDIVDDTEAIAALRQLAQSGPNDVAGRALAERLLRSNSQQLQEEGRAMLESLAIDDDTEALELLASCLRKGCGAFHADSTAGAAWQERDAALGGWFSLKQQIEDYSTTHRPAPAWAWAKYRLLLALDGCFEFGQPSVVWLGEGLRDVNRLQDSLTLTQRTEGEALLHQLIAQWSAKAHAAQGCG